MNTAVGNILINFFVLIEIANLSEISERLLAFGKKKKPQWKPNRSTERLLSFVCLSVAKYLALPEHLEG